jgi:muramoyltetrapeptide carboxypeptidase
LRGQAWFIAPSGRLDRQAALDGLAALTRLEIEYSFDSGMLERAGYLAGTDEVRAGRLVAALSEASAAGGAAWMARGGYGAIRTLEALGARASELPPTELWAFSDGTALLAHWDRMGWPAWHAPPLTQLPRLDRPSLNRLRAAWHAGYVAPFEDLEGLAPGHAEAPLAGGNLCVLASLVGTRWQPVLRDRILLLEDTGEPGYKVDRCFTQLRLAGVLDGIAGLVLGDFTRTPDHEAAHIRELFAELAPTLGVPVARGLPVGHGTRNAPLPHGRGSSRPARLEVTAVRGPARLAFASGRDAA